jgi:hypothetical protein
VTPLPRPRILRLHFLLLLIDGAAHEDGPAPVVHYAAGPPLHRGRRLVFLLDVLKNSLSWQLGVQFGMGIPHPVREEPGEDGQDPAEELLDHDVVVEHGADEHHVPHDLEDRDGDKEPPDVRRVLLVIKLELSHLVVGQVPQGVHVLRGVFGEAVVVLEAQVLLDAVPVLHAARLLDEEQAAVDEDEGVARDVEAVPDVSRLQARAFCAELAVRAAAERGFDHVEERRPEPPEEGGDQDPQQVVLDDPLFLAAAVDVRGEAHEGGQQRQVPAPREFHEEFVEDVVRAG